MTLWHIKTLEGDDLFALADSEEEAITKAGWPKFLVRDVVALDAIYTRIWDEARVKGLCEGYRASARREASK